MRRDRLSAGFTLLEIMLVTIVIASVAAFILPGMFKKQPKAKWEVVLDEVNNLVYYARQEAISNQNVYRLHFQPTKKGGHKIRIEIEKDDPEKVGRKLWPPVRPYGFSGEYTFPDVIKLEAAYHGKVEQLSEQKQHAYCHVIPNGLVQELSLHLKREKSDTQKEESKMTFQMAPFFGRFELIEGFVRPGR